MSIQTANCVSHFINETNKNEPFCPALKQLQKEHIPLTEQMTAIYTFTQAIENEKADADYTNLQILRELVESFVEELEPHSEREEGVLFDMVANHIGRVNGPIAVMEYEHDQAKMLLHTFLTESTESNEMIEAEDVKRISAYAAHAYLILTDHFMKEETVLFPLANHLLSPSEKRHLQEKMNSM